MEYTILHADVFEGLRLALHCADGFCCHLVVQLLTALSGCCPRKVRAACPGSKSLCRMCQALCGTGYGSGQAETTGHAPSTTEEASQQTAHGIWSFTCVRPEMLPGCWWPEVPARIMQSRRGPFRASEACSWKANFHQCIVYESPSGSMPEAAEATDPRVGRGHAHTWLFPRYQAMPNLRVGLP